MNYLFKWIILLGCRFLQIDPQQTDWCYHAGLQASFILNKHSLKAKAEEKIQILYYIIHPFSKLLGLRGCWNISQHLRLKALYYIILYYLILSYINAILYIFYSFPWPFPDCPWPCIATLSEAPTLSKIKPPPQKKQKKTMYCSSDSQLVSGPRFYIDPTQYQNCLFILQKWQKNARIKH